MKDKLKLKGKLDIVLLNKEGKVKEHRKEENLVVTTGLDWICSTFAAGTGTAMSHIAVGIDNTSEVAGNTTLGSEIARVALSSTLANQVASDVVYTAVFGGGVGTGAIDEAGIFNDPTAGVMLSRATFAVVNKDADDTMQITWTITLSAS